MPEIEPDFNQQAYAAAMARITARQREEIERRAVEELRNQILPVPVWQPRPLEPQAPPLRYARDVNWALYGNPAQEQPEEIRDLEVNEVNYDGDMKKTEAFYNIPLIDFFSRNLAKKKTDGEVGLEIECEGDNLFQTPLAFWTVHPDGSLRMSKGGHPPVEYVLSEPLPRKKIPEALDYLSGKLKQAKSRVEESHRSSVHVHVNCQQMTLKEIFTYVCLYLMFENSLVDFSGPDRAGNLFCLRAKDAQHWVYSISQAFKSGRFDGALAETYRYTACNTASLSKFGSLEFRSMRGTVDQQTIQNWVNLLLFLKDKSKEFPDPLKLYEKYISCSTPKDFFDIIFSSQPKIGSLLNGTANLEQGIEEGSIFVRDIAYSIEDWKQKLPPSKVRKTVKEKVKNRETLFSESVRRGWVWRNESPRPTSKELYLAGRAQRFTILSGDSIAYNNDVAICTFNRNTYEVSHWFIQTKETK